MRLGLGACGGLIQFIPISRRLHQDFTRSWDIDPMNRKSLLPVLLVPSIVLSIPAAAMLFKIRRQVPGDCGANAVRFCITALDA